MVNRRPDERQRSRRRRRGGGGSGGGNNPNKEQPNKERGGRPERAEPEAKKAPPVLKRYGVVFFDNHSQAREDAVRLKDMKAQFDQLNIVIKAEGSMEDPELLAYGKVFAGEAWHLIHRRRVDDGWYNDPHE